MAEKLNDLIRYLYHPEASKAFDTGKGTIDLSEPRIAAAREVIVGEEQQRYRNQFKSFYGDELPEWATVLSSAGMEVDPVTSKASFKGNLRKRLKDLGLGDSEIKALQDRASDKLGAFRGRGETFVEGLPKGALPSSLKGPQPAEGSPEEISGRLAQNKQALFAEVAKALQGASNEEQKAAIVREAFGRSGNAEQLFNEFGTWTEAEGQRILQEQQRAQQSAAPRGVLGQLMEALDVPGDILQAGIGAVSNLLPSPDIGPFTSEKVKDVQGREVGFGHLLDAIRDVPAAAANVGTLGLASKAGVEIDRSHDVSFEDLAPVLRELQQPGHGLARVAGYAGGLLGNVATDPLSYVTFGAGGLGKGAATDLLKQGVTRALPDVGEEAAQAAAFQVAQAYGRGTNFGKALRQFQALGYDPQALAAEFPRIGFGRAAAAATQVRGGLTLRAGVPGTKAKVAVTLADARPRVVSTLLDNAGAVGEFIRNPFQLADRLNRHGLTASFVRENPEIAETLGGIQREARGVESRATQQLVGTTRAAETKLLRLAKRARMSDEELQETLNDLIELGADGLHWTDLVARLGAQGANEFFEQAQLLNKGLEDFRQAAIAAGVHVPELADQAAGNLAYLPHKRTDSELVGILASAGIKPARVGATKQRLITTNKGVTDPATGQFYPAPKGTINQLNAVYARIFGERAYEANPFKVIEAYARSLGKAINNTHIVNRLEEEGLGVELAGDIAEHYATVSTNPALNRATYLKPLTQARERVAFTEQAAGELQRDLNAAARSYGRTSKAKLDALADVQTLRSASEASSARVPVILRQEAEKRVMLLEAKKLQEHEEEIFRSARDAELQDLREAGALPETIRATTERYEGFLRGIRADFDKLRQDVRETPAGLRKRLEAHLRGLTPEAAAALRGASGRSYNTILQDAVDTHRGIVAADTLQRYGHGNIYALLSDADTTTEFGRESRRAAELSQRLGELDRRISNETRAGRHTAAANLWAQRATLSEEAMVLAERFATEPAFAEGVQRVMGLMNDPEVSRFIQEAQSRVPVADLIAEQRALAAAGKTREAAKVSEHIAAVRQLGARIEIATKYEDVQRSIRELAELGLRQGNADLARGLRDHLSATLRELDELGRTGRSTASPKRIRQELQARYLREQAQTSALLSDDWRQSVEAMDREIEVSATLQEQIRLKEAEVTGLVATQKLQAKDVRQLRDAFDNMTAENADAVLKLAAQPTLIEHMVPHLSHLAMAVEKLPYTNKTLALPNDIALAVRTMANRGDSTNLFFQAWKNFTNMWKRGTLAVPGSTGRRLFGETLQAVMYAGMPPQYIKRGAQYAVDYRKAAGNLDAITDPTLRGMIEQNIFEGRFVDVLAEGGINTTKGLLGNKVAPLKRYQDVVFRANAGAEDALRAGLFAHAKENLGLSDVGARALVGKFLFFQDELSDLERQVLTTAFPFWNFLRNNTQLQLYMLFHTPGRISAYGNLTETLGEDVETPFGPTEILEQGGIVTPFRSGRGEQEVLYPGLFDIPAGLQAPTDALQPVESLLGVLRGEPSNLGGNELLLSSNPVLQALLAAGFNVNPMTGGQYGERTEPYAPFGQEVAQLSSRQRAIINALIPEARQFEALSAATPGRKEAWVENALSVGVGPTVRPITERTQGYEAADIVRLLRQMNKGEVGTNEQGEPLGIQDVRRGARKQREQEALEERLARIFGR